MSYKENSFFITLTSNSSLDLFTENTLSHFENKLPYTLELDEQWSVGIAKFTCTSFDVKQYEKEKVTIEFHGSSAYIPTDIIDILRLHPDFFEIVKDPLFLNCYTENYELPHFVHSHKILQVKFRNRPYSFNTGIKYTPRLLFDILFRQIELKDWPEVLKDLKHSINIGKPTELSAPSIEMIKKHSKVVKKIQSNIPNYMCIYSDIVKPQIYGNNLTRCMLMHPCNKTYENYQNNEILNIQYMPIEKTRIANIRFLISDEMGEPIHFKSDTFFTTILLHFKKGI
jgi:hypothetical protein